MTPSKSGLFTTDGDLICGNFTPEDGVNFRSLSTLFDKHSISFYLSWNNGTNLIGSAIDVIRKGERQNRVIYLEKISDSISLSGISAYFCRVASTLEKNGYSVYKSESNTLIQALSNIKSEPLLSSDALGRSAARMVSGLKTVYHTNNYFKGIVFLTKFAEKMQNMFGVLTGTTILAETNVNNDGDVIIINSERVPSSNHTIYELDTYTLKSELSEYYNSVLKNPRLLSQERLSKEKIQERSKDDLKSYLRQKSPEKRQRLISLFNDEGYDISKDYIDPPVKKNNITNELSIEKKDGKIGKHISIPLPLMIISIVVLLVSGLIILTHFLFPEFLSTSLDVLMSSFGSFIGFILNLTNEPTPIPIDEPILVLTNESTPIPIDEPISVLTNEPTPIPIDESTTDRTDVPPPVPIDGAAQIKTPDTGIITENPVTETKAIELVDKEDMSLISVSTHPNLQPSGIHPSKSEENVTVGEEANKLMK